MVMAECLDYGSKLVDSMVSWPKLHGSEV